MQGKYLVFNILILQFPDNQIKAWSEKVLSRPAKPETSSYMSKGLDTEAKKRTPKKIMRLNLRA